MGSEAVQIVTAVLVFLGVCVTAYQSIVLARLKHQQEEAALAQTVGAVKAQAVAEKVDEVANTVSVVHTLTNSGMTEVREELKAARAEIRSLQQARVEQALTSVAAAGAIAAGALAPAAPAETPSPEPPRRPPP